MQMMKLAELVLDFGLYPRSNLDHHHIFEMRESYRAGAEFPPIILDAKSKRIVDGFHRHRVYLSERGESSEVPVVLKQYNSDAEIFADAIRYNASHGRSLDAHDRAHCVIIADKLGIATDALAAAMSVTVDRVESLRANKIASDDDGEQVPLKNTIHHKRGQTLTNRQVQANAKLGGMRQVFYVNQLIELLEADLLDRESKELMTRLDILAALLATELHLAPPIAS